MPLLDVLLLPQGRGTAEGFILFTASCLCLLCRVASWAELLQASLCPAQETDVRLPLRLPLLTP